MLDVIATDRVKSRLPSGAVTARIDSLFVLTRYPSRSEILGSDPRSLHPNRSLFVPSAPADTTTPRALNRFRSRLTHEPERSCVTSYPSDPSAAARGPMSVPLRSG